MRAQLCVQFWAPNFEKDVDKLESSEEDNKMIRSLEKLTYEERLKKNSNPLASLEMGEGGKRGDTPDKFSDTLRAVVKRTGISCSPCPLKEGQEVMGLTCSKGDLG